MRRFRPTLTYANVMATLALFIALGGTGYAALRVPRASVGSIQLRRHAVTNSKIAPGAVSASRVKENTLTGTEINEAALGQVPSADRANHASSADTAGSAVNAQNAATLGGLSAAQLRLACPAGTLKYLGECFEVAERGATNWASAAIACAAAGGRLPDAAELATITEDTAITFSDYEWTSDLADADTAITAGGSGAARSQAKVDGSTGLKPFRCASPATN